MSVSTSNAGPNTSLSASNLTGVVPVVKGGTSATTAVAAVSNLGSALVRDGFKRGSIDAGNNAFTDAAAVTPDGVGQIIATWFGGKTPFLFSARSTTTGDVRGSFVFPDVCSFGDTTHMALDTGLGGGTGAYAFICNGNAAQTNANAWDNVMYLQNEQPERYSAVVCNYSSRNATLHGWGVVFGLGNEAGSQPVFAGKGYIEIAGGTTFGIVHDTHGFTTPVFEITGGVVVNFYRNDNTVCTTIAPATGKLTQNYALHVGGVITAGSSVKAVTQATGILDNSVLDPNAPIALTGASAKITGSQLSGWNFGTLAGPISVDCASVGTGMNLDSSGNFDLCYGGVQKLRWTSGGTKVTSAIDIDVASGKFYRVNNVQVLTARQTGWTAATGTPTRTTFATGSVTLSVLAEHVKALIDDLITHGVIGA